MRTKFTFNSETSEVAYDTVEMNRMFILTEELYLNQKLAHNGYLYLNEVYELFGVRWNPEWYNKLYVYDSHKQLRVEKKRVNGNGFDISISYE